MMYIIVGIVPSYICQISNVSCGTKLLRIILSKILQKFLLSIANRDKRILLLVD